MRRIILSLFIFNLSISCVFSQDIEGFNSFREKLLGDFQKEKQGIYKRFNSFRDSINAEYAEFLKTVWSEISLSDPIPRPKEKVVPPHPYTKPIEDKTITVIPEKVPVLKPDPKPHPVEPIKDSPQPRNDYINFSFYGIKEKIRIPDISDYHIDIRNNESISKAWESLCNERIENTLYDLLKIRDKYNLCDWGYLQMINSLACQYCKEKSMTTLLTAYLYIQSGYQMRLGKDNSQLILLYGSKHQIYEKPFYVVDGVKYYPYTTSVSSLSICPAKFEGETPLSLIIDSEQKLGTTLSEERVIKSAKYQDVTAISSVPLELIRFYDSYPTSAIGENLLSRWAMYANTPLSDKTKELLYPSLKTSILDCSDIDAVNRLLNWVQTGFEYEYDDKVWGHDRAFFAEETLYYPYADCEDRSILFSRLVRDLLNLDVALVYYPGHLATAVKFNSEVQGDAMIIDGKRFVICDATFIGAPVGSQMPNLDYKSAKTIILER